MEERFAARDARAAAEIAAHGDEELRKSVLAIVNGKSNTATERARLKLVLKGWEYVPLPEIVDTPNNLLDDDRLRFLIDKNVSLERKHRFAVRPSATPAKQIAFTRLLTDREVSRR